MKNQMEMRFLELELEAISDFSIAMFFEDSSE